MVAKSLIQQSLAPNTKKSYASSLLRYMDFIRCYFPTSKFFPVHLGQLQLFIAYLHTQKLTPNSVQSGLSAINYIHKIMGGSDIFDNFWINKITTGYRKSHVQSPDSRQPITVDILFDLCHAAEELVNVPHLRYMLQSMFLLSFFALLRVGEITVMSLDSYNANLLQLSNIKINATGQVVINFTKFKHSCPSQPYTLTIRPNPGRFSLPITLAKYISLRGNSPGPLFCYNNKPILHSFYTKNLQTLLKHIGLDTNVFKSHSFRIGSATNAFINGASNQQLQHMGRWKSNAFEKYIRIHNLNL